MDNYSTINLGTTTITTSMEEGHINLHKLIMDNLTQDKLVCFEQFFLILSIGRTRIVQVTANHAADAPTVSFR